MLRNVDRGTPRLLSVFGKGPAGRSGIVKAATLPTLPRKGGGKRGYATDLKS